MVRIATGFLAVIALLVSNPAAAAQTYPVRPIRLVVPFAGGGPTDFVARLVAPKMSAALGQPVIVENRPGADGLDAVAGSPSDGYTILIASVDSVNRLAGTKPPSDARLIPIARAIEPAYCLCVQPAVPVDSVAQLIAYGKRNPGKLSLPDDGETFPAGMVAAAFKKASGIPFITMGFRPGPESFNALAAGELSIMFGAVAQARVHNAKVLAVTSPTRYPGLPDVPTLAESMSNFVAPQVWVGLFAPAGVPRPVAARLNSEILAAVNAPDVRPKLIERSSIPVTAAQVASPGPAVDASKSATEPKPKPKTAIEAPGGVRNRAAATPGAKLDAPPVTPHPHRHRTLMFLGSSVPIPDAHARCVAALDRFHLRRFTRYQTVKLEPGLDGLGHGLVSMPKTDWGVIPRDTLLALERDAEKELVEARRLVAESREQLADAEDKYEEAVAEVARAKGRAPALTSALMVTVRDMVAMAKEEIVFDEDSLDFYTSMLDYVRCALANNLPPTIKE